MHRVISRIGHPVLRHHYRYIPMIPPSGALGHFLGLSGAPTLGEPRPPPAPGRVFLRFGEGEPWGEGGVQGGGGGGGGDGVEVTERQGQDNCLSENTRSRQEGMAEVTKKCGGSCHDLARPLPRGHLGHHLPHLLPVLHQQLHPLALLHNLETRHTHLYVLQLPLAPPSSSSASRTPPSSVLPSSAAPPSQGQSPWPPPRPPPPPPWPPSPPPRPPASPPQGSLPPPPPSPG